MSNRKLREPGEPAVAELSPPSILNAYLFQTSAMRITAVLLVFEDSRGYGSAPPARPP